MPSTECGFPTSPDLLVQVGPMMLVNIGFDPSYPSEEPGIPDLQAEGMRALIDTGASECFIDNSLAVALRLPIVDRQTVSSAHGTADVNSYLAQI